MAAAIRQHCAATVHQWRGEVADKTEKEGC